LSTSIKASCTRPHHLCDSIEDREDLQQEILIQLWKSYQNFKGNSEFSTWMYRVAINTAITYLKKEKQRSSNHTDTPHHFEVQQEDYNPQKINSLKFSTLLFRN
jgi:RNA polymerase sigma-70 factor (ECF subfamily)